MCAEEVPDHVPDAVGPRPQDVAARDVVVVDHFRWGIRIVLFDTGCPTIWPQNVADMS